jgi:branched-chain amino acid transport system permease protein
MSLDPMLLIQIVLSGLLLGAVYALLAAGLNLIFGVMQVINVSHGDLMMLGAFITFTLYAQFGLNPVLSLFVSVPILFAVGWLLQRTVVHRVIGQPPLMSLLMTWGLALSIRNAGLYFFTSNYRSVPAFRGAFELGPIALSRSRTIAFVAAFVITLLVWFFLQRTTFGKAVRATAQSGEVAQICGIDVSRVRLVTFGLAAALAGAAGSLLITTLTINPSIGGPVILRAFAIIVIGGMGSFGGALLGALVVGVTEALSAFFFTTQLAEAAIYLLLILVLLIRPSGFFGAAEE